MIIMYCKCKYCGIIFRCEGKKWAKSIIVDGKKDMVVFCEDKQDNTIFCVCDDCIYSSDKNNLPDKCSTTIKSISEEELVAYFL